MDRLKKKDFGVRAVPERHPKGWGEELWITNNPYYCGKKLVLQEGKRCSVHYHKLKEETFYVERGRVQVDLYKEGYPGKATRIILEKGESLHIPAGIPHQFLGLKDSDMFEFSTEHLEEDSYRLAGGDSQYLKKFPKKKVLVVGDVMLDVYIKGDANRVSPEAPVLILLEETRAYAMGGASNVGRNVVSLGGQATVLGVVGKDDSARQLEILAKQAGVKVAFVKADDRPTTTKTRITAQGHQLVRVDQESMKPLSGAIETRFIAAINKLPTFDIVIVSDYAKGVITSRIVSALIKRFGRQNIIVDLKPEHASFFKGVRAITPNIKETHALTGIKATTDKSANQALLLLVKKFNASVIMTRGEYGMSVSDAKGKSIQHIPTRALRVFDVAGAGDTVIAALGLMLASGASLVEAAEAANTAAGVVVGIEGTATVSREELARHLGSKS